MLLLFRRHCWSERLTPAVLHLWPTAGNAVVIIMITALVKMQDWAFLARMWIDGEKTQTEGQHFNFTPANHNTRSHAGIKCKYAQARELMHTHTRERTRTQSQFPWEGIKLAEKNQFNLSPLKYWAAVYILPLPV